MQELPQTQVESRRTDELVKETEQIVKEAAETRGVVQNMLVESGRILAYLGSLQIDLVDLLEVAARE